MEEMKLSYEELANLANQLTQQNNQLREGIQSMNLTNAFKRLDYLFKVLENSGLFSDEFLSKCIDEIEESLERPSETETNEEA